ncbi:hypothetical protein C807_02833 [Lachnospiraceae bacterium 28-4]|nr:hypothetical protein C807_02833 [Lachnospiraceae bacterium 28-4]
MKLGIMQPYFFPYLGYFTLINYVDKFIFFDTVQYISHGWMNRNRILKHDGTPVYITVPIRKCPQKTTINKIEIQNSINWSGKIKGQLTSYKRRAPYYNDVISIFDEIMERKNGSLSLLNIESIKFICKYLDIDTDFEIFSEMNLKIEQVNQPDEWALNISKALGAETYVNAPGGKSFFDRIKYKEACIKLEFIQSLLPPYVQKIGHFESGLSILDVLMFNSKDIIKEMLEEFVIL